MPPANQASDDTLITSGDPSRRRTGAKRRATSLGHAMSPFYATPRPHLDRRTEKYFKSVCRLCDQAVVDDRWLEMVSGSPLFDSCPRRPAGLRP